MIKSLPVLAILVLVALFSWLYVPIRREVVYRLNISGDPTTSCCSTDQVLSSNGDFDESANTAIFEGQVIDYPKTSLAQAFANSLLRSIEQQAVLGTTTDSGEEKWIEVDTSSKVKTLRAWEGNRVVMEFPVSPGKWAPTPKGTFHIWYKTRNQVMKGGSQALGTYYYLPNVPHNMFFYQGYAIHGAWWHNNFGNPMSHGCVNAPLDKIGSLFDWAGPVVPEGRNTVRASAENPGTRVYVH